MVFPFYALSQSAIGTADPAHNQKKERKR